MDAASGLGRRADAVAIPAHPRCAGVGIGIMERAGNNARVEGKSPGGDAGSVGAGTWRRAVERSRAGRPSGHEDYATRYVARADMPVGVAAERRGPPSNMVLQLRYSSCPSRLARNAGRRGSLIPSTMFVSFGGFTAARLDVLRLTAGSGPPAWLRRLPQHNVGASEPSQVTLGRRFSHWLDRSPLRSAWPAPGPATPRGLDRAHPRRRRPATGRPG